MVSACGHSHPDVMRQHARLLGQRLALIELREGPAAAEAAARSGGGGGGGAGEAGGEASLEAQLLAAVAAAKAAGLQQLQGWLAAAGAGLFAPPGQRRRRQRALLGGAGGAATPIRIRPVFQLGAAPPETAARIRGDVLPAALAATARFVRVKPSRGAPQVPVEGRESCLAERPDLGAESARGGSDLLLYVTADSRLCSGGMIAMSASCEIDILTGRPTMGSLNLCHGAMESTSTGQVIDTVVHELVHVLGFSPTHYSDWRRPDGKRYDAPIAYVGAAKAPFLATPRVAAEARRHFGCPTAPGAPLETEGLGVSSLAHFEFRNTQHELMIAARPSDRQRGVLSRLTLAALEDTGWYDPDYDAAPDLEWGRGAGCDFIMMGCREYMARHPGQDLFCPGALRCSSGGRVLGNCRNSSFSDGCLIVSRDPPRDWEPGGAAADFAGNFQCMPPAAVDAATRRLLTRLGTSGTADADRCFAVGPGPAAGGGGGGGGGAAAREGTSINLATALPGQYASGVLACPDARMCRGVSCGACDTDGGFCSFGDGKCHCWLERSGPDCSGWLVPKKNNGRG
ncbi:MAG: hypothetical protein J3K34DRAFT_524564 [Monoraphidium minutum]|nr:MAG: hypothetical protein J3K34DRAFT_524564 [Monoraphidium minutum]